MLQKVDILQEFFHYQNVQRYTFMLEQKAKKLLESMYILRIHLMVEDFAIQAI